MFDQESTEDDYHPICTLKYILTSSVPHSRLSTDFWLSRFCPRLLYLDAQLTTSGPDIFLVKTYAKLFDNAFLTGFPTLRVLTSVDSDNVDGGLKANVLGWQP